jgi:hypothetical protein
MEITSGESIRKPKSLTLDDERPRAVNDQGRGQTERGDFLMRTAIAGKSGFVGAQLAFYFPARRTIARGSHSRRWSGGGDEQGRAGAGGVTR